MEYIKLAVLAGIGISVVIAMFTMLILLRQIVKEISAKNKLQCSADRESIAPIVQVVTPAPVVPTPEATVEKPVIEPIAEETVATEDRVIFSSTKTLTIDDKYLELKPEYKKYYDEIVKYASNVEGSRRFKNARYEEYKVGKNRLVRMLIKRGTIVCEFILPNSDFKNYVNENKLKIKSAPTVLKIIDQNSVQIAKDSIDISIKAIEEEKEYKRKISRERRRQARKAKLK